MKQLLKYIKSYNPLLRFAIDGEPRAPETGRGFLSPTWNDRLEREYQNLHGWCFFPYGPVVLELRFGNTQLDCLLPSEERHDVENAHPFHPQSGSSGFSLQIPSALLQHTSPSVPLSLIAHYAGMKKTIWSYVSGERQNDRGDDLERVLSQYYPERVQDLRAQKASIRKIAVARDSTSNIHTISEWERGVLSRLSNTPKHKLLVFGSHIPSPTGQSTWEYIREKISAGHYEFFRISTLYENPATEDSPYDISLQSLIEYHLENRLAPPTALLAVDWESIQDTFLCRNILHAGPVFHLLDETILRAAKTTCVSKQRRLQLAMNSYAIPVFENPAIKEELKTILPSSVVPILLTESLFSESDIHDELFKHLERATMENRVAGGITSRKLTIIVPVFNALESTKRCLHSARQAIGEEDRVIVVDDCSDHYVGESLFDYCRQDACFTYIRREENVGFIEACYSGLQSVDPDSDIILLNSDVVLPVEAISKIRGAIEQEPSIDLASPLSTGSYTLALRPIPGHSLDDLNSWVEKNTSPNFPTVITPEGQCLFISRRLIKRFGFFDRAYERGFCEESDLGMRAILHGARLACFDNFVVFHEQSASFNQKIRDV